MKKLFCIIGRSASGKSSLTKTVAKDFGLKVVKSYTTRPMREGETEQNSDHYFISDDEVKFYKNQMIAYTEINGYKYFTTTDVLKQSDIYVIDPEGYQFLSKNIEKYHLNIKLIPIYIKVSKDELCERAKKRGDNIQSYLKRYNSENLQFENFEKSLSCSGVEVIHNFDYERSIYRLKNIILHNLPIVRKIKCKINNLKKKGSR